MSGESGILYAYDTMGAFLGRWFTTSARKWLIVTVYETNITNPKSKPIRFAKSAKVSVGTFVSCTVCQPFTTPPPPPGGAKPFWERVKFNP